MGQFYGAILVPNVTCCVSTGIDHSIYCDNVRSHIFVTGIVELLHLLIEVEGALSFVTLGTAGIR